MEDNVNIFAKGKIQPSAPVEAPAFPVTLVTKNARAKWFFIGFFFALILVGVLFYIVKKQVVVVEISGKSADYKEYKLGDK
jgi:hypothetical protein